MVQDQPLVEMIGITKRFGDVVANRDVNLQVKQGEVLGLLGENGAGKTTLMNILFGMYRPDGGNIRIGGTPVIIRNPADAIALGIGMVHQHAQVVDRHTVAENLLVGLPGKGLELDLGRVTARLAEIGRDYGLELAPNRLVGELGVGEKQRLDIVKALFRGARVLILDEPTSVLTPGQAEGLFKAIRALTADGVSVIFISHKLNEVRAITDRVVIMRRGAVVARLPNDAALTNARMAELMCGHDLKPVTGRGSPPGRPMLQARGIVPRRLAPAGRAGIDLTIAAGEIVGLAGVSGNGQVELAEAMAGVEPAVLGSIAIAGRDVERPSARSMRGLGVAYIPEDRMGAGLIGALPLATNLALPRIREAPFSRHGMLDRAAIRTFAERQIEAYDIRPPDPGIRVGLLSGGNQQKAIVARELAFDPIVLIIAQPTRGLDVAASELVHRELVRLRAKGCAVLLISDDLDEIAQLADRIVVIYEGALVYETDAERADLRAVGLAMTGGGGSGARHRSLSAVARAHGT